MTFRRKPLVLFVGLWATLLLVGLFGSATTPTIALADGSGGDTLPAERGDTTGDIDDGYGGDHEQQLDEPSTLDLFIDLIRVLL